MPLCSRTLSGVAILLAATAASAALASPSGALSRSVASPQPVALAEPPRTQFAQANIRPGAAPADAKQLTLSLPAAEAPHLGLSLKRAAAGWDATFTLDGVHFPSDHSATAPAAGEGHVQLFVDNKKVRSIFDPATHIDPLPAGTHEIRVALYTNDGKAYAADSIPVSRRYLVWVNRSKTAPNPAATIKTLDFAVAKGKLTGGDPKGTIRVMQGDTLEINWTVDEPMEVHFHGYDVEASLTPTTPATMLVGTDLAGRFSIEKHGKPDVVLQYIEVYPK